ncbi:prepilin-type N-terminal cleavage/methylation domain-containing protein [Limnobacter sp.]|uniref:type II secretion system protein n=1 Tax=Limnobacter sp. TaxID=2003368 RepID=UPI002590CDE3|nr:prepilin-type N-terminal cleavage/methylation domain-containing protein [Limnobacter sp.]
MKSLRGFSLIELAIALAVLAVLSLPISRLLKTQRTASETASVLQTKDLMLQSVEGFVLTHRRLPCPATAPGSTESWNNGQCEQASGWLPVQSLGLGMQAKPWRMSVATLQSAGPPAANALTANFPLQAINLNTLTDIINTPVNSYRTLNNGALPAMHVCIQSGNQTRPNPVQPGCQGLLTQTTSAVLVIYPADATPSSYQFVIQPNTPLHNPVWLSYERLVWLWMQAGALPSI